MNAPAITGRIVGSSAQLTPAPALTLRSLDAGTFTVGTGLGGLPLLLDPRGAPCGLFADKLMAEATAAHFSR